MKELRLIFILLVGFGLSYQSYQFKNHLFFGDIFIWTALIAAAIFLFIWSIISDTIHFIRHLEFQNFHTSILCFLFTFIVIGINYSIDAKFKKESLLKVYYDGDFNGTAIDFKKDGTYIFENSAIGLSDFYYGKYKINQDTITLDRDQFKNLKNLKNLQLSWIEIKSDSLVKRELYLIAVNPKGEPIEHTFKFRVTEDNRK